MSFSIPIAFALFNIVNGFSLNPIVHTFINRSYDKVIRQSPPLEQKEFVFSEISVSRYNSNHGLEEDPLKDENQTIIACSRTSIIQRLELNSRFDRWKFLQTILEGEVDADDCNQIIFQILQSHLNHSSTPLVSLKQEQKSNLMDELFRCNENGDGVVIALAHDLDSGIVTVGSDKVWSALETILPNPEDDEDAFKCGWDLVVEMYGREATKFSQKSGGPLWKAYADIVRLLIHLDFLSDGILEEPFS